MSAPAKIRRQRHGIQAQQITITLPGDVMTQLREEANRQGITVSRHVVNLIHDAFSADDTNDQEAVAV